MFITRKVSSLVQTGWTQVSKLPGVGRLKDKVVHIVHPAPKVYVGDQGTAGVRNERTSAPLSERRVTEVNPKDYKSYSRCRVDYPAMAGLAPLRYELLGPMRMGVAQSEISEVRATRSDVDFSNVLRAFGQYDTALSKTSLVRGERESNLAQLKVIEQTLQNLEECATQYLGNCKNPASDCAKAVKDLQFRIENDKEVLEGFKSSLAQMLNGQIPGMTWHRALQYGMYGLKLEYIEGIRNSDRLQMLDPHEARLKLDSIQHALSEAKFSEKDASYAVSHGWDMARATKMWELKTFPSQRGPGSAD